MDLAGATVDNFTPLTKLKSMKILCIRHSDTRGDNNWDEVAASLTHCEIVWEWDGLNFEPYGVIGEEDFHFETVIGE